MRILIVDSDGDLIDKVFAEIQQNYIVDLARDSVEGSYLSEINDYDAAVVGSAVLATEEVDFYKSVRASNTRLPIAVISAEINSVKRINALNSGADVCINSSIDPEELDAQLKALIRRNSICSDTVIKSGNISLYRSSRKVLINNCEVILRKKEYDLLEFLFINKGSVVTKEKILEHVWDDGIYTLSNTVEVHIRNLRITLKNFGAKAVIKTRRGFGYTVEG